MKRILFICDQSPFENSYGAQQRTNLLFDAVCLAGQVDLVCFASGNRPKTFSKSNCTIKFFAELPTRVQSKAELRFKKILNIIFSFSPYSVYRKNRSAYKITHDLLKCYNYDHIVIRYIKNAFMCGLLSDNRIIVDVDDLPEQSIISYTDAFKISRIRSLQHKFYAKRAKFHTNHFLKKVNHSFFPDEDQCRWENSSYLPNIPFPAFEGLQTLKNHVPDENTFDVLFVGYMNHSPNSHGVNWFIENIWQSVKKAVPQAVFKIIGRGVTTEQKETWEKSYGVRVLGFVSDIYSVYEKCAVVVVPIFYGAGTNIKVLEAMYLKRACVISDFAARGFKNHLIDNQNILVAINNQDFAVKVIQLLLDRNFNRFIAENGAKTIEEKYSYTFFLEVVNRYVL